MTTTTRLYLTGALVLGLTLWVLTRGPGNLPPPVRIPPPNAASGTTSAAPPAPPGQGTVPGAVNIPGRVPLPRPTRVVTRVDTPAPAAEPAPVPASALEQAIPATFSGQLQAPLLACLKASPPVEGKMLLELTLDTGGLAEAAVVDVSPTDPLPAALLECAGEVVWNAAWPRLDAGTVAVRYPVAVSAE